MRPLCARPRPRPPPLLRGTRLVRAAARYGSLSATEEKILVALADDWGVPWRPYGDRGYALEFADVRVRDQFDATLARLWNPVPVAEKEGTCCAIA